MKSLVAMEQRLHPILARRHPRQAAQRITKGARVESCRLARFQPLDVNAEYLLSAKVLADLQIWRDSGAAANHRENEGGTDFSDPVVVAAEGRYDTMRASPMFAALVSQFAEQDGQSVQIARNR